MFGRTYTFLSVMFLQNSHPYVYLTKNKHMRINDVVLVPTATGVQPAIVCAVRMCKAKAAPYPVEQTPYIIGKATRAQAKPFAGMDMRQPIDITFKTVVVNGQRLSVRTNYFEREELRRRYRHDAFRRVVESVLLTKAEIANAKEEQYQRRQAADRQKEWQRKQQEEEQEFQNMMEDLDQYN